MSINQSCNKFLKIEQVIGTCSVGYDHIDIKECEIKKIKVGYTPGVLTGKIKLKKNYPKIE